MDNRAFTDQSLAPNQSPPSDRKCHCGAAASGTGDYPNVCDQWPICERKAAEEFAATVDRTDGRLDAAVIAYRNRPTEENRLALMAIQQEHSDAFLAEQAADNQAQVKGLPSGVYAIERLS